MYNFMKEIVVATAFGGVLALWYFGIKEYYIPKIKNLWHKLTKKDK